MRSLLLALLASQFCLASLVPPPPQKEHWGASTRNAEPRAQEVLCGTSEQLRPGATATEEHHLPCFSCLGSPATLKLVLLFIFGK